MSFSWSG